MGVPAGSQLIATVGSNQIYLFTFGSEFTSSFGEVFQFDLYNQSKLIFSSNGDVSSFVNYGVVAGEDIFYTTLTLATTNANASDVSLYVTDGSSVTNINNWSNVVGLTTETKVGDQTLIYFVQSDGANNAVGGALYSTDDGNPGQILNLGVNNNLSQVPEAFVSSAYGAIFEVVDSTFSNFEWVPSDTRIYETTGGGAVQLWDLTGAFSALPTPVVTQGVGSTVKYGAATSVTGFSVLEESAGSGTFSVKVTSVDGTLSTSGGQGSVSGGGTTTLTLSGTMIQVNADLAALSFTGTAVGAGSVSVRATFANTTNTAVTAAVTVTGSAPVLNNPTGNQSFGAGQQVTVQLAGNTFTDPQSEAVSLSASLSSGAPLPSWLSFNAATGVLSGLAPADGPQTLVIKVTGEDTSDLSTFETFNLVLTGPASPNLAITSSGGDTTARTHTVSGSIDAADAGLTVSIYDGSTLLGTATPNAAGAWSAQVTLLAGLGAHNVTAQATDAVGNTGVSAGVTFTLGSFTARSDFNGDGKSDLLIENTSGSVVVGEVSGGAAAFTTVSGLGAEWSFKGNGDFLGDAKEGFLIENTAGAVYAGEVSHASTSFSQIAALGPEWSFVGVGDYLGHGKTDFLIENTAGAVVVGEVTSGSAAYSQVAGLGPEWKFVGSGDFLGDGKDDFLIENAAGSVAIGEVGAGGAAAYTSVVALGPEWKFVETGDFLAEGHDQFLIENTAGAVDIGDYASGQIHFTQVTALGAEWKFVGAGDYLGEGHDQFLIENSSGAVVVGDYTGGVVHFTEVATLGPEWSFH